MCRPTQVLTDGTFTLTKYGVFRYGLVVLVGLRGYCMTTIYTPVILNCSETGYTR